MRLENEKLSDIDSIGVRIPTELKIKIKAAAKQNQQSMNAEIVRRLEESFLGTQEQFDSLEKRIDDLERRLNRVCDEGGFCQY